MCSDKFLSKITRELHNYMALTIYVVPEYVIYKLRLESNEWGSLQD